MKKKILFIVESAIYKNDGYKSRIEMEMDLLHHDFDFYVLAPLHDKKDKIEIEFQNSTVITYFTAWKEKIPFIFNYVSLRKKLSELLRKEKYIVYCEALPSAIIACDIAGKYNCKFVYDCHGTAPDEAYLYHPNFLGRIYSKWLRKRENKIVNTADLLVTVSRNQFLKWNVPKSYVLLPMLPGISFFETGNKREAIRRDLGIPDSARVFVYSGQNQKWQMSEETIAFYKRIEEHDFSSYLLILTHQVEAFENFIKDYGICHFSVKSIEYTEVAGYLDACDYGFCLRKNHIINLVASPTKVLEYLSRNVKPILTRYVGDLSEELEREDMAFVLDEKWSRLDFHKIERYEGSNYVRSLVKKYGDTYIDTMRNL